MSYHLGNLCFSQRLIFLILKIFSIRFSRYKLTVINLTTDGDGEIRTLDPLLARQVLSQLSYAPSIWMIPHPIVPLWILLGLSGLEPPTSRLSGVRSNRLSYKPLILASTCFPMPSPA